MPGGPFNVGTGGFPATFLTIQCGPLTVTSRSQLRSFVALSAAAVNALREFVPTATVTINCHNGPSISSTVLAAIATQADVVAMLTAYDRHLDLPHEGPAGPRGPAGEPGTPGAAGEPGGIGPAGAIGFTGPTGVLPTLGTPDFSSLIQSLLGSLASITRRDSGGFEGFTLPGLPPLPQAGATVLEAVGAGGTVNVPVVPGSTADPSGTKRPTFPDTRRERILETLRLLLPQILNEIAARRAQARRQELIDAQLAAFRAALAARNAQLQRERRAPTMPFGQSGFVGPTGSLLGPVVGGALGNLAGDAFEFLLKQLFPGDPAPPTTQPFPSLPAFPTLPQLPGQQPAFPVAPGIPGLQGGGAFGGACPQLFRPGASVLRESPMPWFPVQAPSGKWFFFGHLGKPTFSKLKTPRRHHHHSKR